MKKGLFIFFAIVVLAGCSKTNQSNKKTDANLKQNFVFILSDDHRYDFMGFMEKIPFLETPNMDRMAEQGLHFKNAFVSTSLCSPSRASILTGQYTHRHGVVDNQSLIPEGTVFFPQLLQDNGYQTGFVGKWHMGNQKNDPRPGFDYWASFKGQGKYWNSVFNVNGIEEKPEDSTYVAHAITTYAKDFLNQRTKEKPFFLYISHKSVHAEFIPGPGHKNRYAEVELPYAKSMFPPDHKKALLTEDEYHYEDLPAWVKAQRNSWHGVDYLYHGQMDFDQFYRSYCETLLSLDESIGQILDHLEEEGLMENTTVFYMGDNGFSFGEHGLIDKRQAYEESIRVPLLAMGKGIKTRNHKVFQNIQNIDIAPTILDMAGINEQGDFDGRSFRSILIENEIENWRDTIYYEYFWERPFPQTPTVHAIRTDQFKFIRYHGIWDINELYDLNNDPDELRNLIRDPAYAEQAKSLRKALFTWIEQTKGDKMYLKSDGEGSRFDHKFRDTY